MVLMIFTLMYGCGTRYLGKASFPEYGIGVFAADMQPPPGSSQAFSNDINNIYSPVWTWHTLLRKTCIFRSWNRCFCS